VCECVITAYVGQRERPRISQTTTFAILHLRHLKHSAYSLQHRNQKP